jgi:aspartate kinase
VQGMVESLAEEHIAVHDVITSATSVAVFVDWNDRETALSVIQETF